MYQPINNSVSNDFNSVKTGFPPKPVPLDRVTPKAALDETPLNMRAGDTIIVENVATVSSQFAPPRVRFGMNEDLVLQTIPDDNSCLFHAINFVRMQSISEAQSQELRQRMYTAHTLVAVNLLHDHSDSYSDAMLGYAYGS